MDLQRAVPRCYLLEAAANKYQPFGTRGRAPLWQLVGRPCPALLGSSRLAGWCAWGLYGTASRRRRCGSNLFQALQLQLYLLSSVASHAALCRVTARSSQRVHSQFVRWALQPGSKLHADPRSPPSRPRPQPLVQARLVCHPGWCQNPRWRCWRIRQILLLRGCQVGGSSRRAHTKRSWVTAHRQCHTNG